MPPAPDASFILNGATLQPLPCGALYWPARRMLIVADLHLEKGSAFARTGQFLPPYDSRETLAQLARTLTDVAPERVICLGDSFHDPAAASRLAADDRDALRRLVAACKEWIWIAGNHDPAPPDDLGGRILPALTDGPLVFRHEAEPDRASGEISGHFHPKARLEGRGGRVAARCFVEDGTRCVLPAYGRYTGGLSVLDPAIASLFPSGFSVHLLLRRGVVKVPRARLLRAA